MDAMWSNTSSVDYQAFSDSLWTNMNNSDDAFLSSGEFFPPFDLRDQVDFAADSTSQSELPTISGTNSFPLEFSLPNYATNSNSYLYSNPVDGSRWLSSTDALNSFPVSSATPVERANGAKISSETAVAGSANQESPQAFSSASPTPVPSPSVHNPRPRKRRSRSTELPVPVPGLTKKSRGRKAPTSTSEGSLRRWKCEVVECGRAFVRAEHLKRHTKSIHTNEMYPCPEPGCIRKFSRADNLKKHKRDH
ncbi:hypothetical protein V8B97DRAFT_1919448 [Scleroderma yunnanense]